MCGIVGFTGNHQAAPILLDGLSKLEYRGYDSAGIAVFDGEEIHIKKSAGRLKVLSELTHDGATMPGNSGIGHTRWATHGEPARSMRILMFLVIVRVLVPVKWNPKWSEYIMESLRIMRS
mgnify:CR=1 FL=1